MSDYLGDSRRFGITSERRRVYKGRGPCLICNFKGLYSKFPCFMLVHGIGEMPIQRSGQVDCSDETSPAASSRMWGIELWSAVSASAYRLWLSKL
jgi:hypothetical protein